MTDKTDEAGKGASVPPGSQPRKPSQIIDLSATVVEIGKAADGKATATAAAAGTGAAKAPGEPSKEPQKPAAAAGHAASGPPGPSAPGRPGESARPTGGVGPAGTAKPGQGQVSSLPPKATSPGPVQPRAGGFLSHLTAGVVGAAAALTGAATLGPQLGFELSPPSPELVRRLAAVEAITKAPPGLPADVVQRLQRLETSAQSLADAQTKLGTEARAIEERLASAAGSGGDATQRVARLEETLTTLVAAAGDPRTGRLPQLAQVTTKLGEVETQLTTRTAQLKTELTQAMDQRFARTIEQQESSRAILAQRTQSLETSLKALTEEAAALRTGLDGLKTDITTRLVQTAKPADVAAAVAPVAAKIATLETSVQGVVKAEQDRNATAGNILLSLELANLKRALDRGGRYAAELAAVKKLAAGRLDLAAFEANQEAGVPNLATLGTELSGLAHAMLDADAQPQEASVGERLLSGFKSVVRVRRTDFPPTDTSAEALIARTEIALKEGRLADALAEAKKLSAKAQIPAAAWLRRLEDRAAIDKALADLDASLKTSLAGAAAKTGTTR
jgi:hypothetical protein